MGRTVLIVEDEAALAGLLCDVLQSAGYDVVITTAGQAEKRSLLLEPAAIVMDYLMPGMNGVEVISKIRAAMRESAPPIILVTGLENARDLAEQAGADAYLRKPFDVEALVQIVDSLAVPSVA
ncbi:MAG: response regulator [Chloroflexota bacterium]|nr:MAG: response regulator [Chloroflexota bacterium]